MTIWNRARCALGVCALAASVAGCNGAESSGGGPYISAGARRPSAQRDPSSQDLPYISKLKYRVVFSFGSNVDGDDGALPAASLVDQNGTLFGTTERGGVFGSESGLGDGTVFAVSPTGGETVLHSFGGGSDGAYPTASLTAQKDTFYGTTAGGGVYGSGTVFSISKSGSETVLHSFGSYFYADGSTPLADLVALNGRLYGTTADGGAYGKYGEGGTVFSVSTTGEETLLHSFGDGDDGAYPASGLVAVNGTLYGTTERGGTHGDGTVFSVSSNGAEKVLHSFSGGSDGANPATTLVALNGTLYGTTSGGAGTVFSIGSTGKKHLLFAFGGHDGSMPNGNLISVKGRLYGTTYSGGAKDDGTVFSLSTTGAESVLHSFGNGYKHDGLFPHGGLIDVHGMLYGTTFYGGVSSPSCPPSQNCGYGTVFALKP
jgi:uncharacterized repeat protein (TIGR03803 family)